MNFKRNRRSEELARQADLYRSDGPRERASLYQRAYHHNFEGFVEVREINEHGKAVIRRVYTGKYYEPALEPFRRISLRVMYILCYLGGAALFLYCATRPLVCNTVFYVTVLQCAVILMMIWCAFVLAFYVPATGKLTIGEYKGQHKSLISAARAAAISMWAAAAAVLVSMVLQLEGSLLANLLCAVGFGVSGMPLLVIYLFESHLKYHVTSSGNAVPDDGFEV